LKGARQSWEAAIGKTRPGPLEAHLELGLLSIRERNWDDAERHLSVVTALDPQDVYAWFQLASVYSNLKKDRDAERALLACLRADPDQEMAWLAWRKIKQSRGRAADADSMLDAAREAIAERALHF
jgi:Tfp pilus assembly protein PilF